MSNWWQKRGKLKQIRTVAEIWCCHLQWFHVSSDLLHLSDHQDLSEDSAHSKEDDSTLQIDWACSWKEKEKKKFNDTRTPDCGIYPHRAAALVHPDAALFLLHVCGLESQEVLSGAQAVIVTQHAHNQVQRVTMQHVLVMRASKTLWLVRSKAKR